MSLFSTNQNVTTSTTIDPDYEPYTLAQHLGWNANDILLVIILPIVLALLFCLSIRHCYVSNRRHAEFHERRQNLRALERAQIRENKKNKEKKRKERLKDIEKALVTKVCIWCLCIVLYCIWMHIIMNSVYLCCIIMLWYTFLTTMFTIIHNLDCI